eukprot:jgi/Mesvir1/11637/Mv00038-RA.1
MATATATSPGGILDLLGEVEPPSLRTVIACIASAVGEIALCLRTASVSPIGTTNTFGDKQLAVDVIADKIVFDALRESGLVATASSEELTDMVPMGGSEYAVAFDPLDGSSIVGANWAVGSIFGIWPGSTLLGRTGRDQAAALYAVYGPRTSLVVAVPSRERESNSPAPFLAEFTLITLGAPHEWVLTRKDLCVEAAGNIVAPANLRASADNAAYRALVDSWVDSKYTLRYSGGLVTDMHHIITKGKGIFCNPVSVKAPAKLRVLYEVAPLAMVMEVAGGTSFDGIGSPLDRPIGHSDDRMGVSFGSSKEVEKTKAAMQLGVELTKPTN